MGGAKPGGGGTLLPVEFAYWAELNLLALLGPEIEPSRRRVPRGTRLDAPIRFAKDIARRLGEVPRMVAVALVGSWARGRGHPDSDVALRVY